MSTIALSPLQPYARLLSLLDNTVQASTRNLLPGSGRASKLDAAGSMTVIVPLGDAGDGLSGRGYAAAVLADHPVAYWKMDESGGTVAKDSSGHGNDATYTGGCTLNQAMPGTDLPAVALDGSTGWLSASAMNSFPTTTAYSYEFIVCFNAIGGQQGIISYGDGVTAGGSNQFYLDGDLLSFSWVGGSGGAYMGPVAGTCYHVVETFDGSLVRFYANAVSLGAAGASSPAFTKTSFEIGVTYTGGVLRWLAGLINNGAVYDYCLTPTQITTHYTAFVAVTGFATALLSAGGGPSFADAVPMLLSLSLDGGANFDTHRLVQKPLRDLSPTGLTLTESGDDIFSLYAQTAASGGRGSPVGCSLADVLGAPLGTIVPLSTGDFDYQGFISADHTLPFLCGLLHAPTNPLEATFQDAPGNPTWNADVLKLLQFVALVPTDDLTTPADLAFNLPTTEDTNADNILHALLVLAQRLGSVDVAGDPYPLGSRQHMVADCSDAPLNVARTFAGVVCDGSPSAGSLGGTYGLSNARTGGHEVSRSVVIGGVGAPSGLTFIGGDGISVLDIDETTTAIILGGATVEADQGVVSGQLAVDGGSSDAGFPAGGTITALTQVNRIPADTDRDAWIDCLALIGVNVSGTTGGVYLWDTLGRLQPLNQSQSLPVLDLTVDTIDNLIIIATTTGCYSRTVDVTNTTDPWVLMGGLTSNVTRLAGLVASGVFYVYALVADSQDKTLDGVYEFSPGSAVTGLGYQDWVRILPSENVLDMVSTDNLSFFYIDKANQNQILLYDFTLNVTTPFVLPAHVSALRLDRVTSDVADTVYITTTGDLQAGYYISYDTGTGSWVTNGVQPAQLAVGLALKVNKFVGLNTVINISPSNVTVRVCACTDNGLYFSTTTTPTLTTDWGSANDQNGLAGISVNNVSAGQYQNILGVPTSRMYASSDTAFYESTNSGIQFDDVLQGKVTFGPIVTAWVQNTTSAPPANNIRTMGMMVHSPLGLDDSTHVQLTNYLGSPPLPEAWFVERRFTQHASWAWRLHNPDCPYAALLQDQWADVQANETQDALTASAILMASAKTVLGQSSVPGVSMTIPSVFTQQDAGLRVLQNGQLVHVTFHGKIPVRSSTGAIVETTYLDLDNTPMFVTDHKWNLAQDGSTYAETSTTVSTVFRSGTLSGDDVAVQLQSQLSVLKVHTTRRKR